MLAKHLNPDDEAMKQLAEADPSQPLVCLNLLDFHEAAQYLPEDPEFGTEDAEISGAEAFGRYGAVAGQLVGELGGRMVFGADVEQIFIGPSEATWHRAFLMFFPSRRAFAGLMEREDYRAAVRHRNAALANYRLFILDGSSVGEPG